MFRMPSPSAAHDASLRSYQGMTFFPRIFFLLFSLFHVYHFANPHGFGYTALAVIACFMVHSMFFFWNRYELPAVAFGYVTVDQPRRLIAGSGERASTTSNPDSTPISRSPVPGSASTMDAMVTPLRNNSTFSRSAPPTTRAAPETQNVGNNHLHPNPQRNPLGNDTALLFGATSYASFSSASQHNASGIFRTNIADDDDEDSCVYFMEGEVVLRRNHLRPRPAPTTESVAFSTAAETGLSNTTTMANNPSSMGSMVGLNVDDEEEAEAESGTAILPIHPMSANERDDIGSVTTSSDHSAQDAAAATIRSSPLASPRGDDGGLRAILEVKLTPRQAICRPDDSSASTANETAEDPKKTPPSTKFS